MKNRLRSLIMAGVLIIFVILSTTDLAMGQEDYYTEGHVYDDYTDNPIGGAHIEAENLDDSDYSGETYTDGSGYYEAWTVEGNYEITVSASGYYTQTFTVYVDSDQYGNDIYLYPSDGGNGGGGGGGGDGDGGDDGDNNGNGDEGMPFNFSDIGEEAGPYIMLCSSLFIIFMICIIIIAVSLIGIFSRLGKIKKGLENSAQNQPNQVPQHQPLPPPPGRPP